MDAMERDAAHVRAFNRRWTQMLELLDSGYLDTDLSLPEARVLYELAQAPTMRRRELRDRLGMDQSFLTRVLGGLESRGLCVSRRSESDGRAVDLELTEAGRASFATIDRRSTDQITARLQPLTADQRAVSREGMTVLGRLFGEGPEAPDVRLREPRPGDPGWVVGRHGALYADEFGWDIRFEALVAEIVASFHAADPDGGTRAWIAEVDGARAGCIYCCRVDARTAQLRILLVEPWARGLGIGRLLVDACVAFARDAGYERIALWTNDVLSAARRIYEAAGFELVDQEPHNSFGVELVGQNWALDL